MGDPRHHCHAEGCDRLVPEKMFACLAHWRMVPQWLQRTLWLAYVPGQESRKDATPWYLLVQARCRLAIAEKEGHPSAGVLRRSIAESLRRAATPALAGVPDSEIVSTFDGLLREKLK